MTVRPGASPAGGRRRLGYADQGHLTRDFTAVVGEPPACYARAQPGAAAGQE
ncbi:hypothetical protein [Asanoa iriomotensis]|uniref:hypothetical protein n=1 Tax=Asanoa iriomotensis TaxID=234613 RepID=UPI0019434B59|nr:hypothetical protein [Asanoa iriomotensis]